MGTRRYLRNACRGTLGGGVLLAIALAVVTLSLVSARAGYAATPATWEATGAMGHARAFHTATLLPNGKVLIAGGWYVGTALSSAELYDPSTGTFAATGSMNVARSGHSATLLPEGRVLISGGHNGSGGLASVEIYDPDSGTFWTGSFSMATSRSGHATVLLPTGKVLIVGGTQDSSAELFDPTNRTFSSTGPMGSVRGSPTATLLPTGKVLVVGGAPSTTTAELYDPTTGTFAAAGSMVNYRDHHTATLLPNGTVLIAGGSGPATMAELYYPASNSFVATGSMTIHREAHSATLLPNGKVLVAGGEGAPPPTSTEVYDPETGTFAATGSMGTARYFHTATLLPNGKVLAAGGLYTNTGWLSTAELYTPPGTGGLFVPQGYMGTVRMGHAADVLYDSIVLITGGWAGTGQPTGAAAYFHGLTGEFSDAGWMNRGRQEHTATALGDGCSSVLVAGGDGGTYGILSSAEVFDLCSGGFSPTGSMNHARRDHTATMLEPTLGKVLVVGGRITASLSSAEIYADGTFRTVGSLASARHYHTATRLADGRVLVAGGYQYGYGNLKSAEVFDPVLETFSSTGSMLASRQSHTATLLLDGKVLIAGGAGTGGALNAAELYDPGTGTFTATGPLGTRRYDHTATLLQDGRVLIAGGYAYVGSIPHVLASAEIYDPATGTFSYLGSMNLPHNGHTATLLPDGRVLISGGWGNAGVEQMAEIFVPYPVPALDVTPGEGLAATGVQGGPFSPSTKTYTLLNTGSSAMRWGASKTQSWTTLSSAGGTLAGGASTTVRVSINSSANSLAPGAYSDTVSFTNLTNGYGSTTRLVSLSVASPAADLVVSSLTGPSTVDPGSTITIADTTKNQGAGAAGASVTKFYWSNDTTYDAADVALGSRAVAALAAGASSGPVSTGVTVPAGAGTGTYYILAVADATSAVPETSETNNTRYLAVRISLTTGPDLIVSALTGPSMAAPGSSLTISDTTKNQGTGAAGASITKFVWSTNTTYDTADVVLGSRAVVALAAGASSGPVSTMVVVPSGLATGTYYVIAVADAGNTVPETSESNNKKYLTVRIGPDLIVSALTGPSTVAPGASITISDTTKNQGLVAAGASVTKFVWSANTTYDATDPVLGSRAIPALAASGSSGPTGTAVTVPGGAGAGTYYIIAVADSGAAVTETSETNNTKYLTVKVGPDLIISALTGPSTAAPGASITVSDTTKNQGLASSVASVTKLVWSTNTTSDAADVLLATRAVGALGTGGSSGPYSWTVTVPSGLAGGTYYVIAVADSGGTNAETSETNNTKYLAVKVGADLIVSALTGPATVAPGSAITITETTKNQGTDVAGPSYTKYVWSTNTTFDTADPVLGGHSLPAVGAGSSVGPVSMSVTVPSGLAAGTYYILAVADANGQVAETIETNNTKYLAVKVGPDLIVSSITITSPVTPGGSLTITDTTRNQGLGTAAASVTKFYWSANTTYDASDTALGFRSVPALDASTSSGPLTTAVTVPAGAGAGTYYIIAVADAGGAVGEASETNNTKYVAVKIGSDLVPSSLSAFLDGPAITLLDATTNQGTLATAVNTVTKFYWSADSVVDGSDVVLGQRTVGPLAGGASSPTSGTVSTAVTVPAGAVAGTYYIIAVVDAGNVVAELSETNNTKYTTVTIGPDLVASRLDGPTTVSMGHTYTFYESVKNQGAVAAGTSTVRIYLSRNSSYDSTDALLLERSVPSLSAGAVSGPVSHSVTVPVGMIAGTYYLIAVADATHVVTETSETNNTRTWQVTITQ